MDAQQTRNPVTNMLQTYSPKNPRRPVNWRWQRASLAANGDYPLSRRRDGDLWVARAAKFIREQESCNTELDLAYLSERNPTIFWAYDIWYTQNESGNPVRSEVEARLLADDQLANIARRVATEVEVIEAYERLFFNVRERLADRGYLMHCVLGPAVHRGFQASEYDLMWKLFALLGGPLAVDLMVDQSVGHARPDRASDLKYFVADVAQNDLRRVAMLALKTLRINNFNAMEIIDKFLKLVELERAGGTGAGIAAEAVKQNVDAMLTSLPFTVGQRSAHADAAPLDRYDDLPAELRYEEVMAISAGQAIPAQDMLELLAFPAASANGSTEGEN
jgi:hypothetical protein